jgi:hypothetical protein
LVLVTLTPETDPDVALVNVGYKAVAVDVSLVTVTPEVTVDDNVPVAKDNPVPTVTLLNPPDPLPYNIDDPLVAGA